MTPPPSLSLSTSDVSKYFAQLDADAAASLATLINGYSADTLDPILNTIIQQFLLASSAQPTQIDRLLSFLSLVASHIDSTLSHPGLEKLDPDTRYKSTHLRPSTGPGILSERLSHNLHEAIWGHISRAYTPDPDTDRELPQRYYTDVAVNAAVLARAFATQPDIFRGTLWREVQDVFIKGLFSGPEPEPGVFIALSALILGAGQEVRQYLQIGDHVGRGKGWIWYDDKLKEDTQNATWRWEDIVTALRTVPDPEIAVRLPSFVSETFARAKTHVGDDGELRGASWDSEKLAKDAFGWANEI